MEDPRKMSVRLETVARLVTGRCAVLVRRHALLWDVQAHLLTHRDRVV